MGQIWFEVRRTETSKGVLSVDVHGAAATDTLTATPAESDRRVKLVLDADERVENHRSGLVEVESIALHTGLLGGRVRVPTVDLEGPHLGLLGWRIADRGH